MFLPRCALKTSANVSLTRRSHTLDMVTSPPEGCNAWEVAIFYEPKSGGNYRLMVPSVAVLKGNKSSTMGGESKSSFLSCQSEKIRLLWLVWLSVIDFFSFLTLLISREGMMEKYKGKIKGRWYWKHGVKNRLKCPENFKRAVVEYLVLSYCIKNKNGILRGGQFTSNRKRKKKGGGYLGRIMGQGQVSSGSSGGSSTSFH